MPNKFIQFNKGARPIESRAVHEHYCAYKFIKPSLNDYARHWRHWMTSSNDKTLLGLENFSSNDYTCGTSHAFDQFVLRHALDKEIAVFVGDFQYHSCISKKLNFKYLSSLDMLHNNHAVIISVPFSDFGILHPEFDSILASCNVLNVPVCIDLAYWGIAKNVFLDLNRYQCIQEVVCSLSKPFCTLENHRIGIRFSRSYLDDGISMLNEVQMQNFYSMSLGMHFMQKFSCDWNWQTYSEMYYKICQQLELLYTDTIIFGISKHNKYSYLNRGIPDNHRVCISHLLKDTNNDN